MVLLSISVSTKELVEHNLVGKVNAQDRSGEKGLILVKQLTAILKDCVTHGVNKLAHWKGHVADERWLCSHWKH